MRSALEDHTHKIPNDPKIFSDFRAIRRETTASGNVRFAADRGEDGHSDRFWADALAIHAAKNNSANFYTATAPTTFHRLTQLTRKERETYGL